jgi:hypothetical protein
MPRALLPTSECVVSVVVIAIFLWRHFAEILVVELLKVHGSSAVVDPWTKAVGPRAVVAIVWLPVADG